MDLMLNPEEEQIAETARSLLSTELPVEFTRWEKGAAAAKDRSMLAQFAELGWIALGLPEDKGGFGFGATEEALLFREAGRALVSPRLLACVLAARIAAMAGDEARSAGLITGAAQAGLAVPDGKDHVFLIDADGADEVVLVGEAGLALFSMDSVSDRTIVRSTDETVGLERAKIDRANASMAGDAESEPHLTLLIAALLSGSAEAVRDLAVTHASEREQFGQKIGTFQAVSHPIADMAVRCEAAHAQVKVAAIALRDHRDDAAFQARAARIVALDAALANARNAIQLHGGMGFTAEYPVHFHLKRAHLLDQVGGAMAEQLDRCFAAVA